MPKALDVSVTAEFDYRVGECGWCGVVCLGKKKKKKKEKGKKRVWALCSDQVLSRHLGGLDAKDRRRVPEMLAAQDQRKMTALVLEVRAKP